MAKKQTKEQTKQATQFPPVVTVVGHVDHGKTTLLDAIRKTSIATREHGGITQKIGASAIEIVHEGKKRKITFIDTPGHEAFAKMRSRGARVADVGLLIVSAVDGVMPQTKESIEALKEAAIPFIVVLTKVDLDTAIVERVKQQVLKEGIMLEGLGGDVPYIEVSAKTNLHIKELLDLILLVHDVHPLQESVAANAPLEAIVIESRMDQKAGPRATVVVKNGTLIARSELYVERETFRVRTLVDPEGKQIPQASVGEAAEILGFTNVPSVGTLITSVPPAKEEETAVSGSLLQRELVYQGIKVDDGIVVILAVDTLGSLEAITQSFPKEVKIIAKKTGEVTEADILLAKSTGALVLGFNVKIRPEVQKLAITEKVLAKNYQIIYEMLDEIGDVLEGKRLAGIEQIFGVAQVQASFPFEKTLVLGIKVREGRVARGDKVRLERGDTTVGEATVQSLRSGKNSVSKIEEGHEAGVILTPLLDFQVGDMLICHS